MSAPLVGFAGLTHLGLVSAVAAASKGFNVRGYDPDPARVAKIAVGRMPVTEPNLDELARIHAKRLSYTTEIADLSACDIVYISSDVPTNNNGQSDLTGIFNLIADVVAVLAPKALLVVLCQVPPGFTRKLSLDADRLYYQVETLVFGRAVERATKPERFMVGCADPSLTLPAVYRGFLNAFACPILLMRYESAELAKIAINCCLVASVSVANTLADLSERIGADWAEIVPALRLDRRIGEFSYLTPGLGLAGGNLERDLATVLRMSQETGSEASVITAFLDNSRVRRDWVLRVIHREVLAYRSDATFGILGLAYKEHTHSTKNSPSLALIEHLSPWEVRVFDPVVSTAAVSHLHIAAVASAMDAVRDADAVVVMTPWPEFRALVPAELAAAMRGRVLVDPFRAIDAAAACTAGLRYFTLGVAATGKSNSYAATRQSNGTGT